MKKSTGFTILELLIALSLLILILSFGGGIYLSGDSLARAMVNFSQAHRNAQLALMHIEKNVRNAGSEFEIELLTNGVRLRYLRYGGLTDIYTTPTIISEYLFDSTLGQIIYTPDISTPDNSTLVSGHITNCSFDVVPTDGVVLEVEVTALDNNDNPENSVTLSTQVQTALTASPSVFAVS